MPSLSLFWIDRRNLSSENSNLVLQKPPILYSMRKIVFLTRSNLPGRRFKVVVNTRCLHVGSDNNAFVDHKNKSLQKKYLLKFGRFNQWCLSGVCTSSFWNRWLLWNRETVEESIEDIRERFGITIVNLL